MAKTLDDFVKEVREELDSFEKKWRDENKRCPEEYPLEMQDGNEGLWWEFLMTNDDNA